jgi:hypothetical protein
MSEAAQNSQQFKSGCSKFAGLTPKIPSVFLPISALSDLLGRIHFSTKKSMRT